MKTRIALMVLGAVLLFAGTAGAQPIPQNIPMQQPQMLLPGLQIPQFVSDLPLGGTSITLVNATNFDINGLVSATSGKAPGTPFPIGAYEFQAQILPTAAQFAQAGFTVPQTCGADTASTVWGYLTEADLPVAGVRESYLGPVVLAQKGVAFYPKYENHLPLGGSTVQNNLPIDMTLDWAGAGLTGAVDCPTPTPKPGDVPYVDPLCGNIPPYSGPIPIATHLHGGEVPPAYDGGPDAWFTPNYVNVGAGFPAILGQGVYHYPNDQQEGTIWFHDHALGITRLNVFAGLAGLYPILDLVPAATPTGYTGGDTAPVATSIMPAFPAYDIPLIIQDRSFDTTCEIFYNLASNPQPNPGVHPFWIPEFIGDVIVVNGRAWPFLAVEPRKYRFRLVNGSNARFYDLSLTYPTGAATPIGRSGRFRPAPTAPVSMTVIATDDGYLTNAVGTQNLIIGPGERYEIIVDFSVVPFGSNVTMMNAARTPFPAGAAPIVGLTDRVMQFKVTKPFAGPDPSNIGPGSSIRRAPSPYWDIKMVHDTFTGAATGMITRQLTLNEVIGAGGPLELVVNNSKLNYAKVDPNCPGSPVGGCRESEFPTVGDTEIWEIINITADAHPMHTHLVSFQLIDRWPIPKVSRWINNYDGLLKKNLVLPGEGPPNVYYFRNADGAIGGNPPVWNGPHPGGINGLGVLPYEKGWKDTVITYPGEVTRIAVRWAITDELPDAALVGTDTYPNFDPTALSGGVGYVWHCHIIDHEDNEMMRNYIVLPGPARQFVAGP